MKPGIEPRAGKPEPMTVSEGEDEYGSENDAKKRVSSAN